MYSCIFARNIWFYTQAERLLGEAESFLETEGADALRRAREAMDKAGQQSERMTEIAKEARELAEK